MTISDLANAHDWRKWKQPDPTDYDYFALRANKSNYGEIVYVDGNEIDADKTSYVVIMAVVRGVPDVSLGTSLAHIKHLRRIPDEVIDTSTKTE